jgi:hypothetical protein
MGDGQVVFSSLYFPLSSIAFSPFSFSVPAGTYRIVHDLLGMFLDVLFCFTSFLMKFVRLRRGPFSPLVLRRLERKTLDELIEGR